jgi:hypothetical protein
MLRTIGYAVTASAILALGVPAAHGSTAHTRPAHDAGRADRVTACGVERWAVKTGIDPDARRVNQKAMVPTSIVHMRSLPAPASLPLRNRLRPVETTVWPPNAVLPNVRPSRGRGSGSKRMGLWKPRASGLQHGLQRSLDGGELARQIGHPGRRPAQILRACILLERGAQTGHARGAELR